MTIPQDYHMHSTFSSDGDSSPQAMCRKAIRMGIREIGFSEHWDVGPHEHQPRFLQVEPWYQEIERLRSVFAGRLVIRAGIEIAEPHLYPKESAEVLSRCPFDFVLGSVHFVGPHFMFDRVYFKTHTADEVYLSYFDELWKLVTSADIDIVSHFDVPVRTAAPILGFNPHLYKEQICRILRRIIDRGLALDINTAGLRKPAHNLMPDPVILAWYSKMGGCRVTTGSDAHKSSQVGLHLDQALAAVRAAGIPSLTQFEHRQARPLPLE
jgi:histidinol-phosphatase (PHP family)